MPQIKNGDTTVPFKPFVVAAVTFSFAILLILRSHNGVHKKGLRNSCVNTSERSKNVLKTSLLNLFVKAVIKCSQRLQAVFDFFSLRLVFFVGALDCDLSLSYVLKTVPAQTLFRNEPRLKKINQARRCFQRQGKNVKLL